MKGHKFAARQPRSPHHLPGVPTICATAASRCSSILVPATQIAEWAGHSFEVLLTIYAKCIDGRDRAWFERIDKALGGGPA